MTIWITRAGSISALTLLCVLNAPAIFAQESINKVNGSITANAGQAYAELNTVNGTITIESGVQANDAATVNGDIQAGDDVHVDGLETVNGNIRTGKRLRSRGDIKTVNGSVFIDAGGNIQSVSTANGSIGLVDTDLSGDIETISGDITVGAGSYVKGGITVEKPSSNWPPSSINKRKPPRIVIGPNAVVAGPLTFQHEVRLYVHDSAKIGNVTGATAARYSGPRAPAD